VIHKISSVQCDPERWDAGQLSGMVAHKFDIVNFERAPSMLLYCNRFIQARPKLRAVSSHNSHPYLYTAGSIAPHGRTNTTELESEEAPRDFKLRRLIIRRARRSERQKLKPISSDNAT